MNWQSQPGYREAVANEQFQRDAAYLGLNENIGPFEVVPLTLRHLLILRLMRSPFISGGVPRGVQDIVAFLWLMHPAYDAKGGGARKQLARQCIRYSLPRMPLLHTRRAVKRYERRCQQVMAGVVEITGQIRAYLNNAFMDWPASGAGGEASYFSDACAVCSALAREHRRSRDEVMDAPLKVIFQELKEIRQAHGKPLFNPSDRFAGDWLRTHQDPDSMLGKLLASKRN